MSQQNPKITRIEQIERVADERGLLSKSKLRSKTEFIPKASMPRIWWAILAAVHSMTEQRVQATYVNIQQFLGQKFSSSQLYGIANKGLLIKDKNDHVIYGLTDLAYEFLHEYSHCVTSEQDAKNLGFYHQTLQINMMIRRVAA